MEGLAAAVVLLAIFAGILLVVAFDLFCLVHLAARDQLRALPKLLWAVAIVCISPLGGLAYLAVGRRFDPARLIGDHRLAAGGRRHT
ncbi:MAG TPA: PLDc N-terminal domain-containing protein [Trebonia sp.]|nr:PLDc N-terminal domain-containing protein [Trebonia sp.]